jgi:hypothetical protein
MQEVQVIGKDGRVRPYRRGDRLADGERLFVPYLMDHAAYGFRQTFADGTPDYTNPHRPGYRFADIDDANRIAAAEAYEARRTRMQNAWRRNDATDVSTQRTDAASARAIADRAYADRTKRMVSAYRNRDEG